MFWGQIFVKNAEIYPQTFLNGPNRTKKENLFNAEILVKSVKSDLMPH